MFLGFMVSNKEGEAKKLSFFFKSTPTSAVFLPSKSEGLLIKWLGLSPENQKIPTTNGETKTVLYYLYINMKYHSSQTTKEQYKNVIATRD